MDEGGEPMYRKMYQKLLIIGFSERVILLCLLIVSFFVLFYIIRMAIYFLIKHRCYHLLVYLVTFLIIFLLTKDRLEEFNINHSLYLYLLSLVAGCLTIRLLYKKIIRKYP